MTVFKGYFLTARRNFYSLVIYIGIFIGVCIMIQASLGKVLPAEGFSSYRMKVAVIDRAKSTLSEAIRGMVEEKHDPAEVADDPQAIQDALYYRDAEYVLILPEDLEERFENGRQAVERVTVPDSVMGFYVDMQVNMMLNQVRAGMAGGLTEEEACLEAERLEALPGNVTLYDRNGKAGQLPQYNFFFRYMPYGLLGSVIWMVSLILMEFKRKEIRRRMLGSAVSFRTQNLAALGAFLSIGFVVWLVCVLFGVLLYGRELLPDRNLAWYLLNSFVFMLVALSLGYLCGIISNGPQALNGFTNVISLGLSFLGGVFVPLEMLGKVEIFSQFLPSYWYTRINEMLGAFQTVAGEQLTLLAQGIGIQLAFAVSCLAVTLAIRRVQAQEKD